MLQSINPYNGELLFESEYIPLAEAEKKIRYSKNAFQSWNEKPLTHRIERIERLSKLLRHNKDLLAKMISLEMGKLIIESEAEIEKCADLCDYYVSHAEVFLKAETLDTRFKSARVKYQPLGLILGVMPWNFPFWQVIRFAVPALLSGNTVLLKHASNVSLCSLEIHKLFAEAIGDDYIFQSLLLKTSAVDYILRNGLVNGVSVTGSEEAGRKIGEAAGSSIIKQVYELGGNDSFIVYDNVDIKDVARKAVKARLINCGQSCISAKRFIVHQNVFEEFIELIKSEFQKKTFGNPLEKETQLAPLAKQSFAIDLEDKVALALHHHAISILATERTHSFLTPALLVNVTEANPLYDEELFGPVAIVHQFKTIEDAVRISNSSRYGLSASVWTFDNKLANKTADLLECGSVYINSYPQSDAAVPFGGVKYSGYGREMGKDGLLEFVNRKSIIQN